MAVAVAPRVEGDAAMVTAVERKITYEEFCDLDLPDDDGIFFELLDGVVVVRSSPTGDHQDVVGDLYARLRDAARAAGLGVVRQGPFDVVLGQYNVTMPDLLFVCRERAGILSRIGCFGAPDLIVEALSPTSIERDLATKRSIYERAGVAAYWVIDPAKEQLRRFDLVEGSYVEQPVLGREDTLTSPLFPGLAIPLGEVFAAAHLAAELALTPQAPDVDPERVRFLEALHRQRKRPDDPDREQPRRRG